MSKRRALHLSPSSVIAVIALVAAIGTGAAFGLPGKGSIDKNDIAKNAVKSKQLKNNGVKGTDVKGGTLDGSDIANDSLGGAQVNEAGLGTVPRAADAATVGGLGPEAFERAGTLRTFQERATIGSAPVEVFAAGPFRLVGSCLTSPGGQLQPRVSAQTSENDALVTATQFTATDEALYEGDADFDVGDSVQVMGYQESAPSSVAFPGNVRLIAPSGVSVTVDMTLASRVFSNNPSEQAGCVFAGTAMVDSPG